MLLTGGAAKVMHSLVRNAQHYLKCDAFERSAVEYLKGDLMLSCLVAVILANGEAH